MSYHSDISSHDVPEIFEDEPGPEDEQEAPTPRSPIEAQTAATQRIPAVRPMSSKAVQAMLADVFADVPGFHLTRNPRPLERAFGSEGR